MYYAAALLLWNTVCKPKWCECCHQRSVAHSINVLKSLNGDICRSEFYVLVLYKFTILICSWALMEHMQEWKKNLISCSVFRNAWFTGTCFWWRWVEKWIHLIHCFMCIKKMLCRDVWFKRFWCSFVFKKIPNNSVKPHSSIVLIVLVIDVSALSGMFLEDKYTLKSH